MSEFDLILASRSPRRQELLRQIGVRFCVHSADIEEVHQSHETPRDYVLRLAQSKAQKVADSYPGLPVLGADTIGICDGKILEKPLNQQHCREMLQLMSNTCHQVLSAVAVVHGDKILTAVSCTDVTFRELSTEEIDRYWHTGEPLDKSGSYAIQGLGAVFVQSIAGSYSNVVGLPIEALVPLLNEFEIPVWR